MSRTADPDPAARRALLRAATKLMLARGFSATSVDDVCREANLTKGSLFHYFPTKEALGAAVLDQYLERVFVKLDEIRSAAPDPLARVCACLDYLSIAAEVYPLREGCLLGRLTQEVSQTHPRIRARCGSHFERWITMIEEDLAAAGRQRRLRVDARSLAEHTLAAFEGALILAKARGDVSVVGRTLRHTRRYLEGIFDER